MTQQDPAVGRRRLLQGAMAVGLAGSVVTSAKQSSAKAPEAPLLNPHPKLDGPLAKENERPGTSDWQLTYTKVDPKTRYRSPWIEGYVSHASIEAGEKLSIYVSTNPAAEYTLDIYRLGYYGGDGARLMKKFGPFDGTVQPDPPIGERRLRECQWKESASIVIPSDWPSGVYLGKLRLSKGRLESYIVFIVRDNRLADIVFQCSDNTWQAYNRWPDQYSLYDNGKSEWALVDDSNISYERPYGKYCQIMDFPLSQGSGEFLLWEFPFAYWLEQQGYDVTYVSNTDVHKSADCLTRGKVMLSIGHDEYWSLEQFENVKKAVAEGVNVGFFCGNSCCWVTPLTPSPATGQPARVLRRLGRYGGVSPLEKGTMGPFTMDGPNEASLMGCRTITPFNGSGDWTCTKPDHWLYEKTHMKKGDFIPGLVGWEFHGDPANIPGLEVVSEGDTINAGDQKAHYTATIYQGPKQNWVFNAATIFWAQGLSTPPGHILPYSHYGRPHGPDIRVQQITTNFLQRCLHPPKSV